MSAVGGDGEVEDFGTAGKAKDAEDREDCRFSSTVVTGRLGEPGPDWWAKDAS